jgi:PPOX class probable F420-dependent enzyme
MAPTPLDGERYISLETFRKDGTSVRTPVWAAPLDGKLTVMTDGTSWKVKRLRNNPRVRAAGCDMRGTVHGPFHEVTCRIVDDAAFVRRAASALRDKYGLQWRFLGFFSWIGGRVARRAYLEITLTEAASAG